MNKTKVTKIVEKLLSELGENPIRESLLESPGRVARYLEEILSGYGKDYKKAVKTFPNDGVCDLIIIKDIQFYSLCEHHLVPFFGTVSIGYIPNNRILGLSKFVRLVEIFSKRLQVQERITKQILNAIDDVLQPQGTAINIKAKHLCISMRGVKNESPQTITQAFSGKIKGDFMLRQEFLNQIL